MKKAAWVKIGTGVGLVILTAGVVVGGVLYDRQAVGAMAIFGFPMLIMSLYLIGEGVCDIFFTDSPQRATNIPDYDTQIHTDEVLGEELGMPTPALRRGGSGGWTIPGVF